MEFIKVFNRVMRVGAEEKGLRLVFIVAAIGVACAQILEPVLFGDVIDALAKEGRLASYVTAWMGLGAINALLSIFLSVMSDRYAHRQRLKAMEAAFSRTISPPYKGRVRSCAPSKWEQIRSSASRCRSSART